MRLIDADDLIERKFVIYDTEDLTHEEFENLVNTQPTAYNAEKVEIEIRHCGGKGYRDIDGDHVPPMIETDTVIGLVRKGGVE